jgi:thiol-disulfide isomerase/thioredoxin
MVGLFFASVSTARMRLTAAVLAGLMIALAVVGCGSGRTGNVIDRYPAARRSAAPDLTGPLLAGDGTFSLAAHRNEVVVVNFWAAWCGPCRVEAPDLEQTYQATRAQGVTFVGIDVNDQRDGARAFAAGRSYPSIFDPAGRLALRSAVPPTSIPATMIIDRQGRIAAMVRGVILRDELQPLVESIAGEQS